MKLRALAFGLATILTLPQISTAPPGGAVGGAVATQLQAATGCTNPPYGFSADSDAGTCLNASNTTRVQAGTNSYVEVANTSFSYFNSVVRGSIGATGLFGFVGSAVASASVIAPTGDIFHVTGTTNIDTISSVGSGKCITVIFDGVLTVNDASNLRLAGAFTTSADDVLALCYDGSNWYEHSRSVN